MLLLKSMPAVYVSLVLLVVARVTGEIPSNAFNPKEGVIVHLFEWLWDNIALECEEFLAPRGFKAVQISPPNENLVITDRPWWERYQPVSYQLVTRSGTKQQLADMVRRCNAVGVRIYVDTVINHMTADAAAVCVGTAGSTCASTNRSYPAVPYSAEHFHSPTCEIVNYNDMVQARVCELVSLHDLNQTQDYVRDKIADYMNQLIDLGVGGFRIDAAKHIYPADLGAIYGRLNDLNTSHGFPSNTKAFIYQEVTNDDGDLFFKQYTDFGLVTDFRFGSQLGPCFRGNNDLKWLNTFGEGWGLPPGNQSLVFVENHDTERGTDDVLKYFVPKSYKMAIAFMLSYGHGSPKVMSSFRFTDKDQGPPHDSEGNLLSPRPIIGDICSNGWVCQHRWRQVYNMVGFHNAVNGTPVLNWWDNGKNQISYCRGNKGFVAFNLESFALNQTLQTCLPKGTYCDVISGNLVDGTCTGKTVTVGEDGTALVYIAGTPLDTSDPEADGVLAIHQQV